MALIRASTREVAFLRELCGSSIESSAFKSFIAAEATKGTVREERTNKSEASTAKRKSGVVALR
jgi:hypothetical protein